MEYSLFPDRKIPSQNLLSVFLSLKIKGADIHVSKLSLYSYQCALCKLQSSACKRFASTLKERIYSMGRDTDIYSVVLNVWYASSFRVLKRSLVSDKFMESVTASVATNKSICTIESS